MERNDGGQRAINILSEERDEARAERDQALAHLDALLGAIERTDLGLYQKVAHVNAVADKIRNERKGSDG